MKAWIFLAALVLAAGCKTPPAPEGDAGAKADGKEDDKDSGHGTPVKVAVLTLGDFEVTLDASAHTEALAKVRVVAPFAGTLVSRMKRLQGFTVSASSAWGFPVAGP